MSAAIHLGYEVGTGQAVEIPLRHTAVTGQTQESGKTTTLEGLISRSGLRAVAYITKRGESSFHVMNPIAPYFQERADWKFVQSLLEASTETKMDFKQSWIMRASEGARTLQDVRANIQRFIRGVPAPPRALPRRGKNPNRIDQREVKERWLQKPARGLSGDIYYVLDKYLEDIMPQLAALPYTTKLQLAPGVNVMDLRDYEFPLQALVVRSVIDWTREHEENTINVIPEAWKFAPKQKGSPVRQSAEELIREGGALKNFLWIDLQDVAGVADVLMRQIGVWLFGVQRAKHEIERALDHMPEGLPARRPRPADIATLGKGQFYVCFGREMFKVYVQPAWMAAAHAEAIARGEEEVDSAREILKEFDHEQKSKTVRDTQPETVRDTQPETVRDTQPESDSPRRTHSQGRLDRRQARHGAAETADADDSVQRGASDDCGSSGTYQLRGGDEVMWKEKYEALKAEFEQLREAHDAMAKRAQEAEKNSVAATASHRGRSTSQTALSGSHAAATEHDHGVARHGGIGVNGAPSLNEIYLYVKERAASDPAVLQLLVSTPELRVTRERRVLEMNDTETPGRIGLLIADKFFDQPKNSGDTTKEFKRRGWFSVKTSNAAVLRPLADIAEMGFLTRDGSSYQAVPGMKVNIVEKRA